MTKDTRGEAITTIQTVAKIQYKCGRFYFLKKWLDKKPQTLCFFLNVTFPFPHQSVASFLTP